MALTSARKWPRSGRGARNCHSPLTICIMTSTPSPLIRYAKRPLHPAVITAIIPIRRSCKLIKRCVQDLRSSGNACRVAERSLQAPLRRGETFSSKSPTRNDELFPRIHERLVTLRTHIHFSFI